LATSNSKEIFTFTDVAEPDILQRACTLAVDAFQLVGTDDDVGNGRTIVQDEHGAVTAGVGISVAGTTAIELFVAIVDRARNRRRRSERDNRSRASRDVKGLSGGERHQRGDKGGGVLHVVWLLWCADGSCWRLSPKECCCSTAILIYIFWSHACSLRPGFKLFQSPDAWSRLGTEASLPCLLAFTVFT
jgi:hypothetical protein